MKPPPPNHPKSGRGTNSKKGEGGSSGLETIENRHSCLALKGFSLNPLSGVIWCELGPALYFPHLQLLKWKASEVDKDITQV